MNAFTFDSIALYQRAKGATVGGQSPTNEIKNILYPASVTSTTPSSATVVSNIKGYGTVIDSTNIVVEERYGELGDVLLDKGGKKYWLKSMLVLSGDEMLTLGGVYYNSATFDSYNASTNPNGFKQIGILVIKDKKDGTLMSLTDTSKAWSTNTTDLVPNVTQAGSVRRAKKSASSGVYDTWIASGSRERAELYFGSTYNQYVWPFPRTAWDAMMDKVMSNTAGSGSSGEDWSWTVTVSSDGTGLGVASFTCKQTEGNQTFDPKNYGYSFDKWFAAQVEVVWPATAGAASDMKGLENTKALCAWAGANASTVVPAAYWCNTYAVDVTGYGAGNWYLPACGQLVRTLRLVKILKKKGTWPADAYHWSSTQYSSAAGAWDVRFRDSYVNYNARTNGYSVRAFSAYHFL